MRAAILTALVAVAAAQQNIKDPVNDFCRRHKQQTCVIDSKLYIDGGMVYYGGDKSNDSVAEQSMHPVSLDFSIRADRIRYMAAMGRYLGREE